MTFVLLWKKLEKCLNEFHCCAKKIKPHSYRWPKYHFWVNYPFNTVFPITIVFFSFLHYVKMNLSNRADNKHSPCHLTFDFGCCVDVSIILSTCWQTSHISSYNACSIRLVINPKTLTSEGRSQLIKILHFKGKVDPKMKSSFTHSHVIPNCMHTNKSMEIQSSLDPNFLPNMYCTWWQAMPLSCVSRWMWVDRHGKKQTAEAPIQ